MGRPQLSPECRRMPGEEVHEYRRFALGEFAFGELGDVDPPRLVASYQEKKLTGTLARMAFPVYLQHTSDIRLSSQGCDALPKSFFVEIERSLIFGSQ